MGEQWPRGPRNELHEAAHFGSADRTRALLSSGAVDVNQGDPAGFTPLMLASMEGQSHIVKILLDNGANSSTALGVAAQNGHAEVAKILVDAGADIAGQTSDGCTPRRRRRGPPGGREGRESPDRGGREPQQPHLGRVDADVQRGVQGPHGSRPDPDSREGEPAVRRHEPVRVPVPLDMAAQYGHAGVVRELLREHGIRGCAGVTGGVRALRGAAKEQHVGVMAMLAEAGVADAGGQALVVAAEFGR
ncbi:EsV-1-199 [Ectocarpus siliculosus]|uniref:EsV-1-199 n=1 Tax=Ectocarpus siliculosus TaxID=2880 RepID=D7G1Y7_ECTSI|nr:EsV-1-199 [Ectocarpus siliculosus]|eukprot:CBJ48713.1 EsV-1-199 [Ectocarpus siliculosus]